MGLPRVGHSGAHRRTCAPSVRLPCHPSGARVPACAVPPQPTRTAMPADPSPPHSTAGSAGAWKHSDGRRALRPSLRGRRRDPRRRPSLLGAGFAQRGDGLAPTPDEESAALLQISTVPVPVPVQARPGHARLGQARPGQARPGPAPHGPFAPVERSTRVAHAAGLPPHQRLHCRVRHGAGRRGEGRVLPLCLSFFFSLLPLPRFLAEEARLRVPSSRGSHAAARVQRHAAQPDGLRPAGGDQRQRAPIHPRRL